MTKLREALLIAKSKGIQRPKIKLGRFIFALAPDTGKNPGCVYINIGDAYMGKIKADGTLVLDPMCQTVKPEIEAILNDVIGSATAYGRKTGTCCICGRQLTAKESVAHSIGPICAEKFGFDFGRASDTIDIPEDF